MDNDIKVPEWFIIAFHSNIPPLFPKLHLHSTLDNVLFAYFFYPAFAPYHAETRRTPTIFLFKNFFYCFLFYFLHYIAQYSRSRWERFPAFVYIWKYEKLFTWTIVASLSPFPLEFFFFIFSAQSECYFKFNWFLYYFFLYLNIFML